MNRGKVIAAIHMERRNLPGLEDDDTWRDFLERHGDRSMRAMTDRQLLGVLSTLRGGKVPKQRMGRAAPSQLNRLAGLARKKWPDVEGDALDDPRLCKFVKRTAGVDHPRFLTPAAASSCIVGIEKWLQ